MHTRMYVHMYVPISFACGLSHKGHCSRRHSPPLGPNGERIVHQVPSPNGQCAGPRHTLQVRLHLEHCGPLVVVGDMQNVSVAGGKEEEDSITCDAQFLIIGYKSELVSLTNQPLQLYLSGLHIHKHVCIYVARP